MSIFDILIILITLAVFSLIVVSIANERERRRKQRSMQVNALKRRLQTLEEVTIEVDGLLESRAIPRVLNEEVINLVEDMRALTPDAVFLDALLQTAEARAEVLSDESLPSHIDRVRNSDLQIAKAKKQLEETASALRSLRSNNRISVEELNDFLSQLTWATLMVDVLSLVSQAQQASGRSDVLSSHAFYKKAQHTLMKSGHPDPRRHRIIKEITEILSNRRDHLSNDLMPEAQLQPKKAALRATS